MTSPSHSNIEAATKLKPPGVVPCSMMMTTDPSPSKTVHFEPNEPWFTLSSKRGCRELIPSHPSDLHRIFELAAIHLYFAD
jgi:hypothetical protein